MFNIVLYNPQIPPNTGNIVRLCSNTGCKLHLIKPLGFNLDVKSFKRAGLDYHIYSEINEYENIEQCMKKLKLSNIYVITKFGKKNYSDVNYCIKDSFIFGSEISGLPKELLDKIPSKRKLFLPMIENSRSLNLSNSVSIVVYEAWKQIKFKGSIYKANI